MRPKDADGITNSVNPDKEQSDLSALFSQTWPSEYLGLLWNI